MGRVIIAQATVQLVPVLEALPFGDEAQPLPPGPSRLHAAAWDAYYQAALAEAGFADVRPIAAGERFVAARALIGHPRLDHLVREALTDSGLPGFPSDDDDACPRMDRISPLEGGFALVIDGDACLMPSCCSDFRNIEDWEATVAARPAHDELWMGHPALVVEWRDERVTVAEQWEYPPAPDYLLEATLPAASLAAAVAAARTELTAFRADLVPIVARLLGAPDQAAAVTARLLGL
ncbi:MAG: hypothetical protein JNK64_19215 [Myxococcales bacterium]|nr:hypothetical protein [Myxococcales bacterium]